MPVEGGGAARRLRREKGTRVERRRQLVALHVSAYDALGVEMAHASEEAPCERDCDLRRRGVACVSVSASA